MHEVSFRIISASGRFCGARSQFFNGVLKVFFVKQKKINFLDALVLVWHILLLYITYVQIFFLSMSFIFYHQTVNNLLFINVSLLYYFSLVFEPSAERDLFTIMLYTRQLT